MQHLLEWEDFLNEGKEIDIDQYLNKELIWKTGDTKYNVKISKGTDEDKPYKVVKNTHNLDSNKKTISGKDLTEAEALSIIKKYVNFEEKFITNSKIEDLKSELQSLNFNSFQLEKKEKASNSSDQKSRIHSQLRDIDGKIGELTSKLDSEWEQELKKRNVKKPINSKDDWKKTYR